jgi:hypothetical protein
MHFSLAGGFSSPKLASVMHETNYLTSDAKEATYKRLLETTLFVLDVSNILSFPNSGPKLVAHASPFVLLLSLSYRTSQRQAMEDMTVGTGRGWKSAMRVRLLHAQVRKRITGGKGRYNKYDTDRDGIPINQA